MLAEPATMLAAFGVRREVFGTETNCGSSFDILRSVVHERHIVGAHVELSQYISATLTVGHRVTDVTGEELPVEQAAIDQRGR